MIRKIIINNYRSIEHLDLPFGPMNAFIGPNNSGKSNILRALDVVIGSTWPSRPFTDRDFFGHDTTRTIEITILFDGALQCDQAVHGFRLAYDLAHGVDYCAVDDVGDPLLAFGNRPKRVSNEMRDEVALLYLELDRQSEKQLRPTGWTLYGKLLRRIEANLPVADRTAFVADVAAVVAARLQPHLNPIQQTISDLVQRQTGLGVQLNFRLLDPMETLKGVRPYVIDPPMQSDPDDVGAGVQSAIAIAVAKAYSDIVRQPLMIAIEEPELFLHPHGTRHFYRLLRELSDGGVQIVYATHERAFVSAGNHEAIHIVRRTNGRTGVTSGSSIAVPPGQAGLTLQSRFNDRLNEAFFASAVVLVEGDADEIGCKCAFEAHGVQTDRDSISILGLGGIREIPIVARLLVAFGIPTVALVDQDPGNQNTAATTAQITAAVGAANVFQQVPNIETLFGFPQKPSRVDAMTVFPAWFQGNAVLQSTRRWRTASLRSAFETAINASAGTWWSNPLATIRQRAHSRNGNDTSHVDGRTEHW
jgi:energy-coupling factor transporter ATP-binding protein EcfA2